MPAHNAALFSSASAEHNTPPDIIDAIRDVFGGQIDIDPASNETAQAYIRANRWYGIADNGLVQSWQGESVWLNPPFTVASDRISARTGKPIRQRVIDQWVLRWLTATENRSANHLALLVPARTDTQWFEPLFGYPMCFLSGRLHFSDADNGATFPTMIVYAGINADAFFDRFAALGNVGRFRR